MEKVLVIGAGAQGGPCSAILAGDERIKKVILGDINIDIARKVVNRIASKKIQSIQLDAGNKDELVNAAQGVDVIFNFTLIKFNQIIMETALISRSHYVDTACDGPFLEEWISLEQPKLHKEFKAIRRTALVGCGFAPGVANILTRYACDQMERVNKIVIRAGRALKGGSGEVVQAWKPTWSPEILLEDYADPPMLLENGDFVRVPIFSNPELYTFPEPVGDLLLSSHMHEEPYLIPKFYKDKGLKELDFKYPVDKIVGAFIKMGFANDEIVDINGVRVLPRDVLMKQVERPANTFLSENEHTILQSNLTGIMDICVEGESEGENISHKISYKFTNGPYKERQRQLFEVYGTTMLHVALPAVVGIKMCVNGGAENGVISPDQLDPRQFFKGMVDRGVQFEFDEFITKHTVINHEVYAETMFDEPS